MHETFAPIQECSISGRNIYFQNKEYSFLQEGEGTNGQSVLVFVWNVLDNSCSERGMRNILNKCCSVIGGEYPIFQFN